MKEFEQMRRMCYQLHLLNDRKYNIKNHSKYYKARELLKHIQKLQPSEEVELNRALSLAVEALTQAYKEEFNPPLTTGELEKMDGMPVWVISETHDGKWGIVDANEQCVFYPTMDILDSDLWFNGCYIFKYKKTIKDYSELLTRLGIDFDDSYKLYPYDFYM